MAGVLQGVLPIAIGLIGIIIAGMMLTKPKKQLDGVVHVALLGDSIFDNQVYVGNDYKKSVPGVVERRLKNLNSNWTLSHRAVDGAVMKSIDAQIGTIPTDATHLFMSVIGNDCLGALAGLQAGNKWQGITSVEHPAIAPILLRLVTQYEQTIEKVKQLGKPLTVCNLYAPRFDEPQMQAFCRFAVSELNVRLKAIADKHKVPMIDIFSLFTDYDDYANAIEPGHKGSEKIGKAIEETLLAQLK